MDVAPSMRCPVRETLQAPMGLNGYVFVKYGSSDNMAAGDQPQTDILQCGNPFQNRCLDPSERIPMAPVPPAGSEHTGLALT